MSLVVIHGRLAYMALFFFLLLGIWGVVRFARRQGVDSSYWGALVIAEFLVLVQGGLGAYLWYSDLRPDRGMHILVGFVSGLAIPGIYVYTKGREERTEVLIYGVTTLVTAGLILRAITTAG
jgi:uncharacterized membrane protein